MNIDLSKSVDVKLRDASKTLGFRQGDLLERAVLFYLAAINKQLSLKKEFQMWDTLSDEAFVF